MNNIPIFCPVCNFSLDYYKDYSYFRAYKCCRNCSMQWAESQKEKWDTGWRPSPQDIDKYRKDRITLALNAKRIKHDI
jgi:hypothetical protein